MCPILFQVDGLIVYAYGSILALGFVAGGILILLNARKKGIPSERVIELFCLTILSAIVGSRGLHVLTNLPLFREDPVRVFRIWEGGLVFYGGFLLAMGVAIGYMRWYRVPIWKIADLFAPSIALGLFFARIGCFMAGCCFGKETSLPWGVTFTNPHSLARLHVSLHPTQIYEAAGGLFLFLFLIRMEKKKSYEGEIFWLFLLLYAILRFLIEFVRDDPRGFLFGTFFSTSQTIGILLAILSLYVLFYLKKRLRR
ncbi:MAG: prolipoprotein diacylglyceryl transferase [Deltaproteobacteria bacterium RBG_16_48_10]|nr:MAG: prolipoprotein diacylglyceryl transferase [Deltaproteobacteria bacterium RBG_16_48_10]